MNEKKKMTEELLQVCMNFIQKYEITCPEVIYQSDRVITNSQELIEKICNVIGYYELDEEDADL